MKTIRWWVGWIIKLIIIRKVFKITRYFLSSKTSVETIEIEEGLGPVYDESADTFKILNEKNASFLLKPKEGCGEEDHVLMMISSGPRYRSNRNSWRARGSGKKGLKLVFLVANPHKEEIQNDLEAENGEHGDIVQISIEDGHRKLGYKILSGYVWAYRHCTQVRYVAKSDDNVVLDLDGLLEALETRNSPSDNFIACTTPNRNSLTIRAEHPHMTGNWSISKDQFAADIVPDWCTGFLYVTTPRVGAGLVQAGLALYKDREVLQIEDSLITGVLREQLPGVVVDTYETGLWSQVWLHYLSHCPWMSGWKITFFNTMVISKKSSRSNTHYVGSIMEPGVWRYFLCLHLEGAFLQVDQLLGGTIPQSVWDLCLR